MHRLLLRRPRCPPSSSFSSYHYTYPPPPCPPSSTTTHSTTTSSSRRRRPFSTHPHGHHASVIYQDDGDDDDDDDFNSEEDEELRLKRRALQDERASLGKALLDPAWMHGRRRIAAPPQEGIERMNDLSRLLSGKQIRLHASRLNRRPAGEEDQQNVGGNNKKKKKGQHGEEEDEEFHDLMADEREDDEALLAADAEDDSDDDDDDDDDIGGTDPDAPIEGEGRGDRKAVYSTMRRPTWTGKVASPPEALAYLSTRSVPNFAINLRVLRDVATSAASTAGSSSSSSSPQPLPRSFLDVGCGPGSGLLAAQTVWPEIPRLEGIDHSGAMRDLTKHLLTDKKVEGRGGSEGSTLNGGSGGSQPSGVAPLVLHRHLPPLISQVARTGSKYDVVFASWTLSELKSEASRAMAVSIMWELVAEEGGHLVLIEDGSPEGSRLVRSARKLVLEEGRGGGNEGEEEGEEEGEGKRVKAIARTVGPCPHDRPCPLARHDWCRFSQRVPIGRIQRGMSKVGLGYKDVAFSYVILQKTTPKVKAKTQSSESEEEEEDGLHLLHKRDARLAALHRLRYGDSREEDGADAFPYQPKDEDWEVALGGPLATDDDNNNNDESDENASPSPSSSSSSSSSSFSSTTPTRDGWGRLIRNPRKNKGHVLLDMCTPIGTLERVVVAKGASKPLPGKYMAARKAQWGGLWPFPDV